MQFNKQTSPSLATATHKTEKNHKGLLTTTVCNDWMFIWISQDICNVPFIEQSMDWRCFCSSISRLCIFQNVIKIDCFILVTHFTKINRLVADKFMFLSLSLDLFQRAFKPRIRCPSSLISPYPAHSGGSGVYRGQTKTDAAAVTQIHTNPYFLQSLCIIQIWERIQTVWIGDWFCCST